MIRIEQQFDVLPEHAQISHVIIRSRYVSRQFFFVFFPVSRHYVSHGVSRLLSYIAFMMRQHFIQESQGHTLLPVCHICGIPLKDIYICTDIFRIRFTARRFKKTSELSVITEPAHDSDIMIYSSVRQLPDNFVSGQKCSLTLYRGDLAAILTGISFSKILNNSAYSVLCHVTFKVFEFSVYPFISVTLCFIHIVKLVEYYFKRLIKRIEMYDLLSGLTCTLSPEIGIYQQKRFDRKIVQLKVPCGMIGSNMSNPGQAKLCQTAVCIIIVEVRDPSLLMLTASVFADVMAGCSCRDQSEIHRDS